VADPAPRQVALPGPLEPEAKILAEADHAGGQTPEQLLGVRRLDPADRPEEGIAGHIARYAQGDDYHDVLDAPLKEVEQFIRDISEKELGRAAGVSISEKPLTLQEVREADEIFISSTSRDVQPVNQIDAHKFAAPGPITERLAHAFAEYVTRYFGQPALTR